MERSLTISICFLTCCQGFLLAQNKTFAVGEALQKQAVVEERFRKKFLNRRPPPFQFVSLIGDTVNLKSVGGKIVVVNFWFTTCEPCAREIPLLNEFVEKFKDNHQIIFIALALDQPGALRRFLKKRPFRYQIIPDSKDYAGLLGLDSYPAHMIVGQDGIIRNIMIGAKENIISLLENSVNSLLIVNGE
jgi:thiol-disulfide isomerase/thioredoxin